MNLMKKKIDKNINKKIRGSRLYLVSIPPIDGKDIVIKNTLIQI